MTKSIATFSTTKRKFDEFNDAEIDAFIKAESQTVGRMGSDFDVKSDLFGDDYADAMMSELGLM